MIVGFKDAATRTLFETGASRRIPANIQRVALRKLKFLAAVDNLNDLARQPGNRLERLNGDREGQYSIRINQRYRICFVWRENNAHQVEVVDYH